MTRNVDRFSGLRRVLPVIETRGRPPLYDTEHDDEHRKADLRSAFGSGCHCKLQLQEASRWQASP